MDIIESRPVLETKALHLFYGDFEALKGIAIKIAENDYFFLDCNCL